MNWKKIIICVLVLIIFLIVIWIILPCRIKCLGLIPTCKEKCFEVNMGVSFDCFPNMCCCYPLE
jgi:hypothetical protein